MKNIFLIVFIISLFSCSKYDNQSPIIPKIEHDSLCKIIISPNHFMLYANGDNRLDFFPRVFKRYNGGEAEVLMDRLEENSYKIMTKEIGQIDDFITMSSVEVDSLTVWAEIVDPYIKDGETMSDFTSDTSVIYIKQPIDMSAYEEITIPVIFHLFEEDSYVKYNGKFDAIFIHQQIDRMNRIFSKMMSYNPAAGSTKITFKAAVYDKYGDKLKEEGVNRISLRHSELDKSVDQLVSSKKANWPADKYFNIWLFRNDKLRAITLEAKNCKPNYFMEGTETFKNLTSANYNVTEDDLSGNRNVSYEHSGLYFDLNGINEVSTTYRDFMYYVGKYFGLSNCFTDPYIKTFPEYIDMFDDVLYYYWSKYHDGEVRYPYDVNNEVIPVNIMADNFSKCRLITGEQARHIREIIKNCPDRWAYKSNFAFTGAE